MEDNQITYSTFYISYHEAMQDLSDEQYGRVARAINNYVFYGEDNPDLTGVEKVVFIMAKPSLTKAALNRRSGKKGGAPEGNQNAIKNNPKQPSVVFENNPQNNLEQPTVVFENKQYKEKEKEEYKEKEREEEKKGNGTSRFSLSENLNPNQKDVIARLEGRRKIWNALGTSPPCEKVMFLPDEIQKMMPTLQSYSDERLDQAIRNHTAIRKKPETYSVNNDHSITFVNFIIRWVEQFVDEAKPFEEFRKRGTSPPPLRDRAQETKISLE